MSEIDDLSQIEQLLLMAASVRGLGPTSETGRVNTPKVLLLALKWAGLDSNEVMEHWRNHDDELHPVLDEVYTTLIRMTGEVNRFGLPNRPPERPGEEQFEGRGNWGGPNRGAAHPRFNSCRLTAAGERLALQLLEKHPEYRDSVDGEAQA